MLRGVRLIFLLMIVWLLAVFLPSHTRGLITMIPSEAQAVAAADACCAGHAEERVPTETDKQNCAVCFWAAGLLPILIVLFLLTFVERIRIALAIFVSRLRSTDLPFDMLARGPPLRFA